MELKGVGGDVLERDFLKSVDDFGKKTSAKVGDQKILIPVLKRSTKIVEK